MESIKIPFNELKSEFKRILMKYKFTEIKAEKCAEIFAVNSLEGVYSHGVNRFPAICTVPPQRICHSGCRTGKNQYFGSA